MKGVTYLRLSALQSINGWICRSPAMATHLRGPGGLSVVFTRMAWPSALPGIDNWR
jgi:hypothetical protein